MIWELYKEVSAVLGGLKTLRDAQLTKERELEVSRAQLESLQQSKELHQKAKQVIEAVRLLIMQKAHTKIEGVVTYAVRSVIGSATPDFQDRFVLELVTRRNQFEVDFWNQGVDGGKEPLFTSCGGTYWDTASTALLVSIRSLLGVRSLLYLDESGKFVSPDMAEYFAKFLHEISHQLDCQIVLNSHLPHIREFADASFHCTLRNGCSIVENST